MARPSIRPLVALARHRLARTTGARLGATFGAITAVSFAAVAVAIRLGEGHTSLASLVPSAARWCLWVGGGPVAFSAAHARGEIDRADGIEDLAATRGAFDRELASARALAAMLEVALVVGVPVVALALLGAALSATGGAALRLMASAVSAAVFAAITGVTIGGVAAACDRIGVRHGRSLLLAVIVLPWLLADWVGRGAYSIPGALEAILSYTVGARGIG